MQQRPTNKAYITGGDMHYLPLIEVMAESLKPYLAPTNTNLIIYTFNCDYQIEGFECKRIDVPGVNYQHGLEHNIAKKDNSLYFAKFLASIDALAQYEHICWLDGDAFVLPGIKLVWDYSGDARDLPHPLFMHYHDSDINFWRKNENKEIKVSGGYGAEISRLFNVPRNPYKHLIATGLYVAHQNHIPFFKDILEKWEIVKFSDFYVWADNHAFSEERLANLKMWDLKSKESLPITWVNGIMHRHEFIDFRFDRVLTMGFDVMYHDETREPIMIHGPNSMVTPKTKEILLDAYKNFYLGADKLMIVAHPDDEMIFGGFDLLNEDNWEVLCLTNQGNEQRREEFVKVMEKVGVKEAFIYNLPDDMYNSLPQEELRNIIESHITKKSWRKIVTHNIEGEYGHPHHNQVSRTVQEITRGKKMWQFKKLDRIPEDILQKKLEILKTYDYAKDFIEQIRTHNGRWFIEEDMTTNYVEYGRSVPYPEGHFGKYIPCFIK